MDRETFTQAVEQHQDMVYRLALHTLGSPQDADDAAQETFLRLFRREDPFESGEHLRRWLLRVTVNHCRDVLKSPWRRRKVALESIAEPPAFDCRPERELYQAVMALPEKYRTVLDLFYYEELPVKEIAVILRVSPTVVTTRLSRARTRLKQQLGEEWQDE